MKRKCLTSTAPTPAVPALDLGPLPAHVGYALRRAQMAVFADFHRSFAEVNLRPGQFGVLIVLRENPHARMSQVAESLGIQRTNFTALLNELEAEGLIERHPDPADRRASTLTLSPAGAARLAEADVASKRHERRWMRRLGAERHRALLDLLSQIAP